MPDEGSHALRLARVARETVFPLNRLSQTKPISLPLLSSLSRSPAAAAERRRLVEATARAHSDGDGGWAAGALQRGRLLGRIRQRPISPYIQVLGCELPCPHYSPCSDSPL